MGVRGNPGRRVPRFPSNLQLLTFTLSGFKALRLAQGLRRFRSWLLAAAQPDLQGTVPLLGLYCMRV